MKIFSKRSKADLSQDLNLHRIAILGAINSGQGEAVKRRLNSYFGFVEAILDELEKIGKPEFFNDLPVISQILGDIYDITDAAFEKSDIDMVLDAMSIPSDLRALAVRRDNFACFVRVSELYKNFLYKAYDITGKDVRRIVMDRAWRSPSNFANYTFVVNGKHLDQQRALQYMCAILWTFSELMKITIDRDDSEQYLVMATALEDVFRSVEFGAPENWDIEVIEVELEKNRNIILLGLGGWLVKKHIDKSIGYDNLAKFFEPIIKRFKTIRELSRSYLEAGQYLSKAGWDTWILRELPEGKVHSINYSRWLTFAYCLHGIRMTPDKDIKVPEESNIPVSDNLITFKLDEIRSTSRDIFDRKEIWKSLLLPNQLENWERFVELNETAVGIYEVEKADRIFSSRMSERILEEYKKAVESAWESSSWLDLLFRKHGKIEFEESATGDEYLAIANWMPKEYFLEEKEGHWVGFGEQEGKKLGLSVSEKILEQLMEFRESNKTVCSLSELDGKMNSIMTIMTLASRKPQIIIVMGGYRLREKLATIDGFMPDWEQESEISNYPYYAGTLDAIPVFHRSVREESHILILNIDALGEYIIYKPKENAVGDLLINIEEMTPKKIEELVQAELKKRKKPGETKRKKKDIIMALRQQVHVFIGYRYKLNITNPGSINIVEVDM